MKKRHYIENKNKTDKVSNLTFFTKNAKIVKK